jgi:hypothetical protein
MKRKGCVLKKRFKILGLSIAVAAILALVIAGTVGAAGNDPGTGAQTQNQGEECLCGECPCGDYVCGDCVPDPNLYLGPGPHGLQAGK